LDLNSWVSGLWFWVWSLDFEIVVFGFRCCFSEVVFWELGMGVGVGGWVWGVGGLWFGVCLLGFGVWCLGFGVWGSGFGESDLGFGVWGLGFMHQ